ncbi:MAG: hypothetical protein NWF13_08850 [Candidatus Bathyarchaeota archaeon]|nr:hypothetical protein [Candidatus Bathyarchaeota archaeon]
MTTLPPSFSSVEGSRCLFPTEGRFIGIPLDTETPKVLKLVERSVLLGRKQEGAEYSWLGLAG